MAEVLDDDYFDGQSLQDAVREGMAGLTLGGPMCKICGTPVDDDQEACDEHAKELANRRRRKTHSGMMRGDRERLIQQAVGGIGFAVIGTMGDQVCGTAVIGQAEAIAWNLEEVAAENPSVDRTLSLLSKGSGWVGLAAACFPILSAVYTHHFMAEGGGASGNGHVADADAAPFDIGSVVRNPVSKDEQGNG